MKKLYTIVFCISLSAAAHAQAKKVESPNQTELKTAVDTPVGQFKFLGEGATHDFKDLPEGPVAEYTFKFKNTGKAPIVITEAHGSCGCTKPEWPKEPIKPGKKGEIVVRYNTQGRVGPFTKDVYVTSNVPSENNHGPLLHIKGTVKPADKPAASVALPPSTVKTVPDAPKK